jgi:hypothetical protein
MANLVSVRLEWVLVSEQERSWKSFWRRLMNSWVMWLMWNLVLVRSVMVLVSKQDRCTVCVKRTIGLEIVLEAPDGTPS